MKSVLAFAQKAKSKRWLPGKLRAQHSFALPPPAPAGAADQIRHAEDEQSKHAMTVALATAAAAEAAVAAAHAAAHVVRLTGQPPPVAPVPPPPRQAQAQAQEQEQEQAAVAIQSAYRGYLVRRRSSNNADFCSCNNSNKNNAIRIEVEVFSVKKMMRYLLLTVCDLHHFAILLVLGNIHVADCD